jgi:hypothetical protein
MAWHEASHIICALYNYFQVYTANISTITKNEDGNTCFLSYDEPIDDPELKRVILIFELQVMYAGLVGERLYYKQITGSSKLPMHLRIGSSYDIKLASGLIRKNELASPGKKTQLLKKQIQYDVEKILTTHWEDVKIIAHLLYCKKKLCYSDLKYALTRKSNNKQFWKDRFKKIKIVLNDTKCPTQEVVKDIMLEDVIFSI